MAHDVFISYSAEDKPTADAVCATLEAKQIRCWVAPRDVLPGQDYAEGLVDAIGQSSLMVLVFSSNSNNSPHVMREVERAASKGIAILPLRIEDVAPSKSMEYFISRMHWLDALTPPLEKHLQQLAETVRLLITRTGGAAKASGEPEAAVSAPSAEPATDAGMGRPPPWKGVLEVATRWGGRPLVRIALGIGAVVAVTIIVVVALLSGGGEGDSGVGALTPASSEGSPTVGSPSVAPTPSATPTAAPANETLISGKGPSGKPGTLWVSSIPQGGRVYVAPHGSREADYPGPSIPDESYFKGITPMEVEIAPGDYDVAVSIDTGEDRTFARDESLDLFSKDVGGKIIEQGRMYENVKVAEEQETLIALFQVEGEPYSTLLDSLPDEWLFNFPEGTEEEITQVLKSRGVPEAEFPAVLEILHKGGKVALRHTKAPTIVLEIKAYGFSERELG